MIDNACVDATEEVAREYGRVVRLPDRRSYAAAMNAGLAATRDAGAVLLLNADCVLEDGALAALAAHLERDPGLGAAAPKLVRDDDPARIDAAGMSLDRRRKNNVVGHGEPATAFARAGEVFDEDLALWASDADLAWRARLLGWRAIYEPAARGRHVRFFSPSTRAQVAAEHRRLQFRNRLLMIAKNERPRDALRDLPHLLVYEILALGYALVVERELLGAYRDAWRALPGARRRRARRRVTNLARPPFGLLPPH